MCEKRKSEGMPCAKGRASMPRRGEAKQREGAFAFMHDAFHPPFRLLAPPAVQNPNANHNNVPQNLS